MDAEVINRREAIVGLAGSVGGNYALLDQLEFDSRAALSQSQVVRSRMVLHTSGFATAGDGGAALYKRAFSEPVHPGKVQSADGAWWELAETTITPRHLGAKGDGISDDAPAFQALATYADSARASSFYLPPTAENYLLNSIVSFTNPGIVVHGNHGAGYDRGGAKKGWILVGIWAAAAFDLGASRVMGEGVNPADNWTVSRIGIKQDVGVAARTKDGFRLTSRTNGPDRGAIFRECSGRSLHAAIRVMNPSQSVSVANLIIENGVFIANNYAVYAEGNVLGLRFIGNQAEQNILGAVHGCFSAGITIGDNMLEGQPNPINITAYPLIGNRPKVNHFGNYYEACTGQYILRLRSTTNYASFISHSNYFLNNLASDDYVLTGAGSWLVDIKEQGAAYRGLTLDAFYGGISRKSRWLQNGSYRCRAIELGAMSGALYISDYLDLQGDPAGGYTFVTPPRGNVYPSPFGDLICFEGPTFINIPIAVGEGHLIAISAFMFNLEDMERTNAQIFNEQTTLVLAESSVSLCRGGWSVVQFNALISANTKSLRFRIRGATAANCVIAGIAVKNHGTHTVDGSKVETIYPVMPKINRALLNKKFVSSDQTITTSGALAIAHNLDATPNFVQLAIVCQTAEAGYSVGDIVPVHNGPQGSKRGQSLTVDSANIIIRFGSDMNVYELNHKSTGAITALANSNWKLRVTAVS